MNRKVIQLGTKTLLVSIPINWAKTQGIIKGNSLEIQPYGSNLILRGNTVKTKTSIDITDFNVSLIRDTLESTYRNGDYQIELLYNNPTLWDKKELKNVKIADLLHGITEKFIGFGITKISGNKCTLAELNPTKADDVHNSIKNAYQTALSFAKDISYAISNQDHETLSSLADHGNIQIKKLVNFSLRQLSQHQPANLSGHKLLLNIEILGEVLRNIAIIAKDSWKSKEELKEMTKLLQMSYDYYQSPSRSQLLEIESSKIEFNKVLQRAPLFERELMLQFERFIKPF